MNIGGKTVLVTGGALRIGGAVCRTFAESGAKVIIHCNRSLKAAEELLSALPGCGHQILQSDLNSPEETDGLLAKCGKVDILVNNAAVYRLEKACEDQYMQINFLSPLSLMKQFFAQKIEDGCIINFLDQEVAKEYETSDLYLKSKRSLRDATLDAALNMAPAVRVNAIAPGPVLPPVGLKGPGMQVVLKLVPLKRQISLEDITAACIFLARNDSITGQVIYIDGGQHLS